MTPLLGLNKNTFYRKFESLKIMTDTIIEGNISTSNILFSDKATFSLNRDINRHI